MIRALGGLLLIVAAMLAFSSRPLTRESRIVIERRPLWLVPTPFGWGIIFGAVIGLTGAALALFPIVRR